MLKEQKYPRFFIAAFFIMASARVLTRIGSVPRETVGTDMLVVAALTLLLIIVNEFAPFTPTIKSWSFIILAFPTDLYLSFGDGKYFLTPMVIVATAMAACATLQIWQVVGIWLYGNSLAILFCVFFPESTFRYIPAGQVFFSFALCNLSILVVYFIVAYARKIIVANKDMALEANFANAAKDAFLSSVSHEIRTPMNAIFGINEMILSDHGNSSLEEIRERVQNIKHAGKGLQMLIDNILDFVRLDEGRLTLCNSTYFSDSLFKYIDARACAQLEGKACQLSTKLNLDSAIGLVGDDVRIAQICWLFISFHAKFSPGGVEFIVGQQKDGDAIILDISVSAFGFELGEKRLSQLLDAAYVQRSAHDPDALTDGLGLCVAKRLIDIMGGTFEATSKKANGTVFRTLIPQAVALTPPKDDKYAAGGHLVTHDAQALLVDDNLAIIQILRGIFKSYCIDADTASSGADALEKIAKNKYDIVFIDHMMPEMDGVECAALIRKISDSNTALPLVAMSADDELGAEGYFTERGFNAYLAKPIELAELERVLRAYIPANKITSKSKPAKNERLGEIEIPGLDAQAGIFNCGGTVELFCDVLEVFCTSTVEGMERYEKARETNNLRLTGLEAHSLKSAAFSIGAMRLGEFAGQVESAAKKGDSQSINFLTPRLLFESKKQVSYISGFLKAQLPERVAQKQTIGAAWLVAKLETVIIGAKNYDLESSAEMINSAMTYNWPNDIITKLISLKQSISHYSYQGTIGKAQDLLQALRGGETIG